MDPIIASSVAANVVQFIDYSTELVSKRRQIHGSSDRASLLSANIEIDAALVDLQNLCSSLKGSLQNEEQQLQQQILNESDQALTRICKACVEVSNELVALLKRLKASAGQRQRKWKSFRQAFKSVLSKHGINEIIDHLDELRAELRTHVLLSMRKQINNESVKLDEYSALLQCVTQSLLGEDFERNCRRKVELGLLHSLRFDGMNREYDNQAEAYKGTLEWIFREPRFEDKPRDNFSQWLESGRGMFWISGKPGSGKSTLMKFISEDPRTRKQLQKWASSDGGSLETSTFFFSCIETTKLQAPQNGLLRSLLYDILKRHTTFIPILFPEEWKDNLEHSQHGLETSFGAWPDTRLEKAFRELTSLSLEALRFCFFIDGLDEYDGDHLELVNFLSGISTSPFVKLVVTARPEPVFVHVFESRPSLGLEDLIRDDLIRDDIQLYVEEKLGSNKRWKLLANDNHMDARRLVADILHKAEGCFLLAALVTDQLVIRLSQGNDFSDIAEYAANLPSGLQGLYDHMFAMIEGEHNEAALKISQQLERPKAYESDAISIASVESRGTTFLETKGPSSATSATLVEQAARDQVLLIFLEDNDLRDLYSDALGKRGLNSERFENNLQRLIGGYCDELEHTSYDILTAKAVNLVRKEKRWICRQIRERFRPADLDKLRCMASLKDQKMSKLSLERFLDVTLQQEDGPSGVRDALEDGTSPNSDDGSESSDDDKGYSEFPHFEQIRKFLVDSTAFDNLRTNFRNFVYPSSKKRPAEVELRQGDVDRQPRCLPAVAKLQDGIASVVLAVLIAAVMFHAMGLRLANAFFGTSPLPSDILRVEWICKCGHISYDDFGGMQFSFVESLAHELQESGAVQQTIVTDRAKGYVDLARNSLKNGWNNFKTVLKESRRSKERKHQEPELPQTETALEMITTQPQAEALWLLFCINETDLATVQHVDIRMTKSDGELFICLKGIYGSLRSKLDFLRRWFLKISMIHFVQFQLLPKAYVDGFEIDTLPPPHVTDYTFTSVSSKPPVGPNWMLHLYKRPDHGDGNTLCLERFPKKKRERLQYRQQEEIIGWGIYFTETVHIAMVATAALIFMLIVTLVFGICWTVLKHDISGAWTVSAWITSCFALGITAWSAWKLS